MVLVLYNMLLLYYYYCVPGTELSRVVAMMQWYSKHRFFVFGFGVDSHLILDLYSTVLHICVGTVCTFGGATFFCSGVDTV